jgi:hypothetical protein
MTLKYDLVLALAMLTCCWQQNAMAQETSFSVTLDPVEHGSARCQLSEFVEQTLSVILALFWILLKGSVHRRCGQLR